MRLFIPLLLAGACFAAKEAPDWVRETARQAAPPDLPPKVDSFVLLEEEQLTVAPDGRRTMRERHIEKVLHSGRRAPVAYRSYNTKTGRIRDIHAWLLPPSGKEVEFGKARVLDIALSDELYDEGRAKMIECDPNTPEGSVFAWEAVEEEDTIFTTYHYSFQEIAPVAVSRFVLTLPAGWEARGAVFNHDPVSPRIEAGSYTWELRNLPWIEDEEHSPGYYSLAARLGVTYFPSSGARPELRPMKDWPAVSAWLATLVDPPAEVTDAVRAKSAALTAGAVSELDRIRAIASFVQDTNYVSVQLNETHGGGYTPHAAEYVLSKNYGDCKDKATLMRALLKAAGIDSYAVVIYARDRRFVRPEWPTPMQFNHAILAVKVSAETKASTVLEEPKLGRLLIFDPTDPNTPVGDLPRREQGSYALVVAGPNGDLLKAPELPPAADRIESSVRASMEPNGQLHGEMETEYLGQSGSRVRSITRRGGVDEVKKRMEAALSSRLPGIALEKVTPADHRQDDRLDITAVFAAARFGQLLQERLLVIKPGALAADPDYAFPAKPRRWPVLLTAKTRKDGITIQVPPGFAVDELPDPVQLDGAYGSYHAQWKSAGGAVVFEQSLEVKDSLAPAAEYDKVRDFFDRVAGAQASAVVLTRQ